VVVGHFADANERDAVEKAFVDRAWAYDVRGQAAGGAPPEGEFLLVRVQRAKEDQPLDEVLAFAVGDEEVGRLPPSPAGSYDPDAGPVVMEASYWAESPRRCVWVLRSRPFVRRRRTPAELPEAASEFAGFVMSALAQERLVRSP
jgi:hypothetical protein